MHPPVDNSVRPGLRVLGAMLTISVAFMFGSDGISLWSAAEVPRTACHAGSLKSQLLCHVGSTILLAFPPEARSVALAVTSLTISALFLVATWLLVRPLIANAIEADRAANGGR